MITGVLGARLWYVIFMWNELYAENPLEIIMFRHGGLAIQGGIFVGLIFSWWYFKNNKLISWLQLMQLCRCFNCSGTGRWGNFFNQEAYGGMVSLDFLKSLHLPNFIIEGMHINGYYYHPTFYMSLLLIS